MEKLNKEEILCLIRKMGGVANRKIEDKNYELIYNPHIVEIMAM